MYNDSVYAFIVVTKTKKCIQGTCVTLHIVPLSSRIKHINVFQAILFNLYEKSKYACYHFI